MTDRSKWIWMPHAAHFICGNYCRFKLATFLGENGLYIVSTVGEYLPQSEVREILAKSRRVELTGRGDDREAEYLEKIGFEELGFGRKYETMVFPAKRQEEDKYRCCPYIASEWSELDMQGYNDPAEATKGHYEMCEEWAVKP